MSMHQVWQCLLHRREMHTQKQVPRLLSMYRRRMRLFRGGAVNICILTWEPLASQKCRNTWVVDTLSVHGTEV